LDALADAVQETRLRRWSPLVANQVHYSLVRREAELSLFPFCRRHGIGILVWSPLAAGYLTGKYRLGQPLPAASRRADPAIEFPVFDPNRGETVIEALEKVAGCHGATTAQVALAWSLSRPEVTSLLIGVRHRGQLESNLQAVALQLRPEDRVALERASRPSYFDEVVRDGKLAGVTA